MTVRARRFACIGFACLLAVLVYVCAYLAFHGMSSETVRLDVITG